MLKNGEAAPEITALTIAGKPFSATAGRPLVALFVRGRFCPTTRRFLAEWQDFYARAKDLGCEIVALAADSSEDLAWLQEKTDVKFPLLRDEGAATATRFGAYIDTNKEGRAYSEPALVIVDSKGAVAYSVISSGPKGLPDPGSVAPILVYMAQHEGLY